jgi:hypothetical protein
VAVTGTKGYWELLLVDKMTKHVLYFAYGSNLLAQRIHINIPSAVRKEIGKLEASFKIQKADKDILHYQVMINFQCMKLEKRDTCICLIRKYMNFILKLTRFCTS